MSSEMQVFNAAELSLKKGVNLVEASAGTGKTFAIAMLALRFVAELGIPVDRLLIVTFTKAATEELKMRIRARLSQARDLLLGRGGSPDQTLAGWAAGLPGDAALMLERLQLALYDIDRAGIFTIHSFCQRMLQEQALESGQLFDMELLADTRSIRGQVVDDFWRTRVYGLAPLPCAILTSSFPTPDALSAGIGAESAAARIEPEGVEIAPALARLDSAFARLAGWWRQNGSTLYPLFTQGLADKAFKKEFCEGFETGWQRLGAFLDGASPDGFDSLYLLSRDRLTSELNGSTLRGEQKRLAYLAGWPLPEDEVADYRQAETGLLLAFRVTLARTLAGEVQARLQQQGALSFNDLILRLSCALKEGSPLKGLLAERYRVVLIDEFQDTDQAQWHIFSTVFGGGDHYLYLIGDPKQAIYRFRGADIFSYFAARNSASARLTLDKNYRSHPHLVEEVNRLFGSRPQAFGFQSSIMEYHPVVPARTPEEGSLQYQGQPWPAVIYCQLPETEKNDGRWGSGRAGERILQFVLGEAARILDPASPVLLIGKDGQRPVRPRDIGILVRSNRQAEQYRQAFAQALIPAVVASRQSVFDTAACREMFALLEALAAPGDMPRLKAAMTLPWFGLSGAALVAIWQDEACIDAWANRFQASFKLWREQGFMTMMSRLLIDEKVLVTLASQRLAERHIANIHHLMELIQAAETGDNLSPGRTLQWLRAMMAGGLQEAQEVELRLESDEEAVRIVTMHSAKGLEYPIVFCPLLWSRSGRLQRERAVVSCHEPGAGPVTDLGSSRFEERKQRAVEEELSEELRLLYVAVTRAKLCNYIFWADVRQTGGAGDSFSSGLGYLLFPGGYADFQGQQEVLRSFARRESVEYRTVTDEAHKTVDCRQGAGAVGTLAARQPSDRSLRTDWQMSSYSALASLSDHDDHLPPDRIACDSAGIPCPGLPAGAGFGNVVHGILESIPFSAIAAGQDVGAEQQCRRYGVKAEPESLRRLLQNVVATPLPAAAGLSLSALEEGRYVREMPFYFHPDRIVTARMNAVLAEEPTVTPLAHREMQGYLTGFVDLFCEWDGRYYILDYKTNHLGELIADYAPENLVRAMETHNYGLQYWIYTLVLHRHLCNILPGYSYERHFGGVMYLFVRGMVPAQPGSGVFFVRPDKDVLDRLSDCMGAGI
ncbi:MAG: exodeoxyribonuclease V subunit beta [Desulfocapsaceae bacterium]|nr:exodeoxyribonuclease V subunit beta [Desulfocapsaceae bacterium]